MKRYKIAAVLMMIHGGLMEIGGALALLPVLVLGPDVFETEKYFSFAFAYFQENLYLMMIIGAIFGALRFVGAVGLLKNRMWGFVLSLINCTVTLALMAFMLPAGIFDGLLAGCALLLILTQYYGKRKIEE